MALRLLERVEAEEQPGESQKVESSGIADASTGDRGERSAWLAQVLVSDAPVGACESAGLLERVGLTPLPPYILSRRTGLGEASDDGADRTDYQTVFADGSRARSVAAPTAGLHLTPGVLERIRAAGARTIATTLHVSAGTFKPIESDLVELHRMHAEWCEIPDESRRALADRRARCAASGTKTPRLIAVGTTSARALESFSDEEIAARDRALTGWTRLLITPGYEWKRVDGLLTNFHLPRSTLLAMVAALLPGGVTQLKAIYALAQRERYRFFSFGDAMLVLP